MKNLILLSIWLVHSLVLPGQDPGTGLSGSFTDSRDGRAYKWVRIGTQVWMAENLAFLPAVNRMGEGGFEEGCYYVYDYDGIDPVQARAQENYINYGTLYNWKAALESCPGGWHLPSDAEWIELEKNLGMEHVPFNRGWIRSGEVGNKLKSVSGWVAGGGRDQYGFYALPGGCRGYGGFESLGFCGYFWTASPAGGDNGWRRGFCGDDSGSCREEDRRYFGISVRCVKDKAP